MRLRKRLIASSVAVIVGVALSFGHQGTAVEPETDADASNQDDFRTWTDDSGHFRAEAKLVHFSSGMVTLKKKDGETVNVSLDRLSDADRQYIKAFAGGAARDESADSSGGDDGTVRTEAREVAPTRPKARTSYRTAARTTARTTVGSSGSRGTRRVVVEGVGLPPRKHSRTASAMR